MIGVRAMRLANRAREVHGRSLERLVDGLGATGACLDAGELDRLVAAGRKAEYIDRHAR